LFLSVVASSQNVLKGVMQDAEKSSPIPNASVFLNATSIGTATDAKGNFLLTISNGRYELFLQLDMKPILRLSMPMNFLIFSLSD
jgi:CarboxypepD_reg-like domain